MSELRYSKPHGSAFQPLEWEEKTWEGGYLGAYGKAAERLSDKGRRYQAAVPTLISGLEIELDREVSLFAREAEFELTRFDAEANGRLGAFGPVLLRSEAASSSQIENLTASARQIFTAEAAGKGSRNASEIAANARAMIEAIELADRLSVDAIRQMHRELMSGQGRHTPGEFRTDPVWIGTRADSPIGASYVAPDHGRIAGLMTDLIGYVSREDLPSLEQVAIAHAQFETIHPFSDGNGRTGRALAQAMLRHSGITRNVVVPVSAGLLTNVDGYHQALTDYRAGDPNTIVHAFAAASMRAVPNGRQLITDLDEIAAEWEERQKPRRGSIKKKILDLALARPVFTAENVAQQLGIPPSNIYRYLKELQDAGVLAMKAEYQGPRIWRAPAVLAVVDEFAHRAGRRT